MIVWLKKELLMAIHDRQLAEHSGSPGLRDESLLESALARPQQKFAYGGFDVDLAALAASLAFGLAPNHPFVDGNKRTAFVACRTFIKLNGGDLVAEPEDKFHTFLALAEGRISEQEFAQWLRERVTIESQNRIQEEAPR